MERTWALNKITCEFYQGGNTDGTTEETEELKVEIESCFGDIEKEHYMVLRTPTGWSINNPEELFDLLKEVEKGFKLKNEIKRT